MFKHFIENLINLFRRERAIYKCNKTQSVVIYNRFEFKKEKYPIMLDEYSPSLMTEELKKKLNLKSKQSIKKAPATTK